MKSTPSARHRARKLAVQALYQLHFQEASPSQVIQEFLEDNDLKRADVAYFEALVLGVSQQKAALWNKVCELLDRAPEQIDITESVDLAKIFGATDSYKYVNSILDGLAMTLRTIEVGALQVR